MSVPAVIPAIYDATKNSRIRTSMAFGSDLESGWSGSATNPSGATGWYQILLPVHPDITAQQAEDPVYATNYMLPAYTAAVANVSDNLWSKNPELAAEQAVIMAEQPGGPFPSQSVGPYGGEGTAVVNADWQNTANTLTGQWKPGNDISLPAATTSATSNSSSPPQTITWAQAIAQGPTGILQWIAQQAANKVDSNNSNGTTTGLNSLWDFLSNPVDALERLGLIVFGAVVIITGLAILASGSRTAKAVTGAATRGVSTQISGSISGQKKNQQERLSLAKEANAIGERKLALKERREERLSGRQNIQRQPIGRHRKEAAA